MTTTVTVKARAHGAIVSLTRNGQEPEQTTLEANRDQNYHLDEGDVISVVQGEAPAIEDDEPAYTTTGLDPKNVPGREQNDELLKGGVKSSAPMSTEPGDRGLTKG